MKKYIITTTINRPTEATLKFCKIAKEKNTTVEKIKKENNLKSDLIQVGQKLKI